MLRNLKLSVIIPLFVSILAVISLLILFFTANANMTSAMETAAKNHMDTALAAKERAILDYVESSEQALVEFSKVPLVADLLRNPEDSVLQKEAQEFTLAYFHELNQWEGLYISKWDTTVLTHVTESIIGKPFREGERLKTLQDALNNGLYNVGIVISPASGKQTVAIYAPVYDTDGSILGMVGGGPMTDSLISILDTLKVTGFDSSSFTMLKNDSKAYIFQPDSSLVGTETKEAQLLSILDKTSSSKEAVNGSLTYTDNGTEYLAMYKSLPDRDWTLVMTDPVSEVFASANKNKITLIIQCIICFLMIASLCFLLTRFSLRPLYFIEKDIEQLKDLHLSAAPQLTKYKDNNNEIGHISNAIFSLHASFNNIASTIESCSSSMQDISVTMNQASNTLVEGVADNSATTQELAASISTTNEAIHDVVSRISNLKEGIHHVTRQIEYITEKTHDLSALSGSMSEKANESLNSSETKIIDNRKNIEKAMENLNSITRINDMVDQILDIASQTNLLSLNASIEAARAGEAGKGFAVVADQIGSLAQNSSETATDIQGICSEINANISLVQSCFNEIIEFMEKDVNTQLNDFANTANESNFSVEGIQKTMDEIKSLTQSFSGDIDAIQTRIETVQTASNENEIAVEDIIEKIEQTSMTAESLNHVIQANQENSDSMKKMIDSFS